MSTSYLPPPLPHQEAMVARPEFGRPVERRYEVPCDHSGRRTISPSGPSWVGEGNSSLFHTQTGDNPPGDLISVPLKEGR